MVRLTRISSDFNIAKMRDSFMRQFMEQAGDGDLLSGPKSDPDDIKTSGKHLELSLLVDQRQKSLMGTPTRKAVVSSLIRLVMITLRFTNISLLKMNLDSSLYFVLHQMYTNHPSFAETLTSSGS